MQNYDSEPEGSSTHTTLAAMRSQEASYATGDFLCAAVRNHVHNSNTQNNNNQISTLDVDVDCRTKMVQWCYQVADYCRYNHETVAVAMGYLDRYLLTPSGLDALRDRTLFQLASMTCFYTAVKICEPVVMNPDMMVQLARGGYTSQQIVDMERTLLQALQWRMNPPTSMAFCRHLVDLLLLPTASPPPPPQQQQQHDDDCSNSGDEEANKLRATILEICHLQTEAAITDYDFIAVKPSTVAYCAVMNALESLSTTATMGDTSSSSLEDVAMAGLRLATVLGLDRRHAEIVEIQTALYDAVIGEVVVVVEPQQEQQQPSSKQARSHSHSRLQQRQEQQQHLQSTADDTTTKHFQVHCNVSPRSTTAAATSSATSVTA